MRFYILYSILGLVLLTGCKPEPKNLCECLEQAFVLQNKKNHRLEKNLNTEQVDKEMNQLKKHCHHLIARGSTCSIEKSGEIVRRNNHVLWDAGEEISRIVRRPDNSEASFQLDFIKNIQAYINRVEIKDSLGYE